jgi:hypothetical protein
VRHTIVVEHKFVLGLVSWMRAESGTLLLAGAA